MAELIVGLYLSQPWAGPLAARGPQSQMGWGALSVVSFERLQENCNRGPRAGGLWAPQPGAGPRQDYAAEMRKAPCFRELGRRGIS